MYPEIRHINDILPYIQDSPEFIVAEKEGYKVLNYVVATHDTFPSGDIHRRECRGLIFDSETGKITRRPLHKFHNIGEREDTMLDNIDFSKSHKIFEKLDGSMIAPFEIGIGSGIIRFGTKMGVTDVSMQAEVFVSENPRYMNFAKWCISNEITPIFEWVSNQQRIVLDYPKDDLILIAARHMVTGEYIRL